MAKDNFSAQSRAYAVYRPRFPGEIYDYIFEQLNSFDLAWDAATGNGQSALVLASRFKKVFATDISESQLAEAPQLPNITYWEEAAEACTLDDHSCDLVMVSQALHWLDFDRFYSEVKRVMRPGGVIAACCYSVYKATDPALDELLQQFYRDSAPYWDPERRYIDEEYRNIPFPFERLPAPAFSMSYQWTLDELLGYISTWSAYQHYNRKFGKSMVTDEFRAALESMIPAGTRAQIHFPVHLLIGRA